MAKLGGILLNTVYTEERGGSVKTTDKPIENGLSITDHVEKDPVTLKLSGVCAGSDAATRIAKLQAARDKGQRLTYVGRFNMKNMLITSISERKDVTTKGTSYYFDIDLKQINVVTRKTTKKKKAKPKTNKGKQQPKKSPAKKRTHVVKRGETLSKIAQKYYGKSTSTYYMRIYNANKKVIGSSPNRIKEGMKLIIP